MIRATIRTAAILVAALVPALAFGDDGLWRSDFEAAREVAQKEQKPLLVNFTGSDWCVYCKRLGKEVFNTEEFKKSAPTHFVLVELDFPHEKKLSEETVAQNRKLQKKYGVSGFPTVLVVDPANAELIAKTGYRKGTAPADYMKTLDGFVVAHKELEAIRPTLADKKGTERAKLLDRIVTLTEKLGRETDEMTAMSKEIQTLDPENEAGLKSKHEFRSLLGEARHLTRKKSPNEAIAVLEKARQVKGATPEQIQDSYANYEGECRFQLRDFEGLEAALKKAIEVAPDTDKVADIRVMLERFAPMGQAQKTLRKGDDDLKDAKGLDRAKALDRLIDARILLAPMTKMTPDDAKQLFAWKKEAAELDADNTAGLKTKHMLFPKLMTEARVEMRKKAFDEAIEKIDEMLKLPGLSGPLTQETWMLKASCRLAQQDRAKAIECFEKALEAAPESPRAPAIREQIEAAKSKV